MANMKDNTENFIPTLGILFWHIVSQTHIPTIISIAIFTNLEIHVRTEIQSKL